MVNQWRRPTRRKKSTNTGPDDDTRMTVHMRADGYCERCGIDFDGVGMMSIHHRRPRRMGGTSDPVANSVSNLMAICGSGTTGCHGWIESHRTEAYTNGWLLYSGQNPGEIPAYIHGKGFRLLTSEGAYKALWE